MDITSKVSREARDDARINRERTSRPADVEPGMEDFEWDEPVGSVGDSPFSSGSDSSFGGSPFGGGGSSFGGSPFGGGGSSFDSGWGTPPSSTFGQPDKPTESTEDKFFKTIGMVFKGFFTFTKELVESFKTFDVERRMDTGRTSIVAGVICAIVGFGCTLFGLNFLELTIAGLVSAGVGVPVFMFAYDDFKNGVGVQPVTAPDFSTYETNDADDGFGEIDVYGDDDDDDDDEFVFEIDDEEEPMGLSDSDFNFDDFSPTVIDPVEVERSRENVLASLPENGLVPRGYFFDIINQSLINIRKDFNSIRILDEDSAEFDAWDSIVQSSARAVATKTVEEDLPYLITAKEKLFYIHLEIKRVSWIKNVDNFVNEIVNIYRYDRETGKMNMTIYGMGEAVGDSIFIKIMKGETAMVSVKDTYGLVKDDIIDTKNMMPIVLGVDEEGTTVWEDFKNINSILVTGMPRSGKTWLVQAILTQMMFYKSPSELQFHILDPKGETSDFKSLEVPHVRKFVSEDSDILEELRRIVKVEGVRRTKIISDAGFINIMDYNKANPDNVLPLLYVVIDEVITLAERMDSSVKDEFQSLLLELVSRLPNLGVRIFMIPHVVKDQVLKKSITDLIPCRISVLGDAKHIESSTGTLPKNFKHKLQHVGDMAVRLSNGETRFVHSVVLSDSNEGNNELFDFLTKLWMKIEPDSIEGSLYQKRRNKIAVNRQITVTDKVAPKLTKTDVDELLSNI